jgi:hypothetical protein
VPSYALEPLGSLRGAVSPRNSCTAATLATALPWSDPDAMREYARVTHSVSAYAGLGYYSNLTDYDIDVIWEKLAAGVAVAI